jgi:hypothetical protein
MFVRSFQSNKFQNHLYTKVGDMPFYVELQLKGLD